MRKYASIIRGENTQRFKYMHQVSPKRVSVRIHASETLDLTSRQGVFSPYKKKTERREKSTDPIFSSQSYLRFQIFPQRQERRIDPFAHRFQNFPEFHNFTTDIYIYIYILNGRREILKQINLAVFNEREVPTLLSK